MKADSFLTYLQRGFMHLKRFHLRVVLLSALTVLSACGGSTIALETPESSITRKLTSALTALSSGLGLNSNSTKDLFDSNYLDGGVNRASLNTVVDATIAALASTPTPDLSLFPSAEVTNTKVIDCDSNLICTMSATLTNKDTEDTIAVDFTTKVKIVGADVYLYGDQLATAPI